MKTVALEEASYRDIPGVSEKVKVSSTVLRMKTAHNGLSRLRVCYTPADGLSRRATGGPVLPGPYAVTYALPVMISDPPLPFDGPEILVEDGDVLEMDGTLWQIRDDKWLDYPHLYPVEA